MHVLRAKLNWLDVPQRVTLELCVRRLGTADSELCVLVADRRQLRSASRELLYFPRCNMTNNGWREFKYACPHS